MERKNFDSLLKENQNYTRIQGCKNSVIYNLKNGEYLKLVNRKLLGIINSTGYSLETRLEAAEALRKLDHLSLPTSMVEQYGDITGYTTKEVQGKVYTKDTFGLDLKKITDLHHKIEICMQRNHGCNIVTPDLATPGNIMIMPNGELKFMDYEGMQVNFMQTFQHSLKIGTAEELKALGYINRITEICTPKIDVLTATTLYLENIFGVNIVHFIHSMSKTASVEAIISVLFETIELDDDKMAQKVANLFIPYAKKEFLGKDMDRIVQRYELVPAMDTPGKRKLRRK